MTDKEIRSGEAAIVQKQAEEALAGSEALLSEAQEVSRVGGNVIDITKFKRMEISLQEARKMAERYLSVAAEVILGLDAQGNITLLNDSGHRLLGYAPGELIGKNWFDTCLPEEARTEVHGIFAKLMDGEYADVLTYENSIITRSGNRLDLLWHNTLLRDTNGRIAGALSSAEDITERKRAEDKLRVAQLQWSQFLAASPDAMWIKDASGRYVAASKTYFHLDPSAEGNIIGKTDAECFPPEKATVYVADDRIAIETGASEGEFTAVGDDGKLRTFLTKKVVLRAPDGSVAGTLGVSRDITDRKQAEEEIQRERVFFDRLVETAPEGIAITDTQGRVMRVNAEFVRMFGYGADEAVGQSIDNLVAPPARQEEARAMTASAGQGKTNLLETVRRRKDGTLVDVSLIDAPILIAGKQEAVYAIYRDITERKQAEAQLRQSQKMEAIGELAGGVAHDFNNLLTGILGNIAIMRSSLPPADSLVENLNAAETSARQAADLTKGLLTFSRSAMVLPVPINITAALDATLALLKQSLPATIDIVRDYEQTTWNVLLDRSQLTQILLNLAVNARDAMKGKGTLTIRARNVTIDMAYVHELPYARTGEFVHLSVTDTGLGMSSEVMQHLFEPFYTTKPIGSGTGLGLSVVYGAVKQAGGWITAVSTEGVGATFDIHFPRCLEEPMQSFTPSPLSVNVCSGTVLVVEDEPIVRAVNQALLSRSGYTVLTAPDGASALSVLRDHPVGIGLILLDMTMPGMTSGEVVQAIRALDPTVPILLNSGYTSSDAVKQMLKEDSVQGFLGKPYDLDQLLEKVQMLLHRG